MNECMRGACACVRRRGREVGAVGPAPANRAVTHPVSHSLLIYAPQEPTAQRQDSSSFQLTPYLRKHIAPTHIKNELHDARVRSAVCVCAAHRPCYVQERARAAARTQRPPCLPWPLPASVACAGARRQPHSLPRAQSDSLYTTAGSAWAVMITGARMKNLRTLTSTAVSSGWCGSACRSSTFACARERRGRWKSYSASRPHVRQRPAPCRQQEDEGPATS